MIEFASIDRLSSDNTRYANSAINMVSDFVTALLPIGVIRSLEIPKRQKQLLYAVFCVGLM